jgi:hypothetical protein
MKTPSLPLRLLLVATLAVPALAAEPVATAPLGRRMRTDITNAPAPVPASPAAASAPALPPLPEGVVELRFEDFFKTPVGPRGLEISSKLLALEGKRVRVYGYMVHEEIEAHGPLSDGAGPTETGLVPDRLMLTAAPQMVSFADFALSDDLPPQVVFVTLAEKTGATVPYTSRPLLLTGVLSVGQKPEPEGRISLVRLKLDPAPAAAAVKPAATASPQISPVQSNNNPNPVAP